MSWAEVKKAINSNITVPLNTLIMNAKDSILSGISTNNTTVINSKNEINTNITNAKNGLSTNITTAQNNVVNNLTPKITTSGTDMYIAGIARGTPAKRLIYKGSSSDNNKRILTVNGKGFLIRFLYRPYYSTGGNSIITIDSGRQTLTINGATTSHDEADGLDGSIEFNHDSLYTVNTSTNILVQDSTGRHQFVNRPIYFNQNFTCDVTKSSRVEVEYVQY